MNILLVGDNSTHPNWGGRAASIALRQLLGEKFIIQNTIYGSMFNLLSGNTGYIKSILPSKYMRVLLRKRGYSLLTHLYLRLEEIMGARDYIDEDPVKSVDNIIKYKNNNDILYELYNKFINADVVVVNGEGDLVLRTPPKREVLFMLAAMEMGCRLNKKVYFVNSVMSDCARTGRNERTLSSLHSYLSRCNGVSVRDGESLRYVNKFMPSVRCTVFPDSLFYWYPKYNKTMLPEDGDFILPFPEKVNSYGTLNFSKPYICIGGSDYAAWYKNQAVSVYEELVNKIKMLGYPVYLVQTCGGDSFLIEVSNLTGAPLVPVNIPVLMGGAIVANARVFVTGRFHPTIFASFGGTPVVILKANSHKMYELNKLLYSSIKNTIYPSLPDSYNIKKIYDECEHLLNIENDIRHTIKNIASQEYKKVFGLLDFIRN